MELEFEVEDYEVVTFNPHPSDYTHEEKVDAGIHEDGHFIQVHKTAPIRTEPDCKPKKPRTKYRH
jgi:hypothetical protein